MKVSDAATAAAPPPPTTVPAPAEPGPASASAHPAPGLIISPISEASTAISPGVPMLAPAPAAAYAAGVFPIALVRQILAPNGPAPASAGTPPQPRPRFFRVGDSLWIVPWPQRSNRSFMSWSEIVDHMFRRMGGTVDGFPRSAGAASFFEERAAEVTANLTERAETIKSLLSDRQNIIMSMIPLGRRLRDAHQMYPRQNDRGIGVPSYMFPFLTRHFEQMLGLIDENSARTTPVYAETFADLRSCLIVVIDRWTRESSSGSPDHNIFKAMIPLGRMLPDAHQRDPSNYDPELGLPSYMFPSLTRHFEQRLGLVDENSARTTPLHAETFAALRSCLIMVTDNWTQVLNLIKAGSEERQSAGGHPQG